MMPKSYVYILSDEFKKLVIKSADLPLNFEDKQLVYYEIFDDTEEADKRRETIESWPVRKIQFLINLVNPTWDDWKKEIVN
jgi:predicted GIY-YIG superfamily endonuclease